MPVTAQEILESVVSRFRPEKARGLNTVFHFDITGDETLHYTVIIREGRCELNKEFSEKADCIISAEAANYIALETGALDPQSALMGGKVKVSNLVAMMQFAKCFRKYETADNRQQTTDNRGATSALNAEPQNRTAKTGPLAGLKIIDFTRLLPGPLATMFLADMGADVIKIEDPDNPDYIRSFDPKVNGESMYYLALNRNKRSLAVNYLSPEGKQTIYDLVKSADVLIEQFRPGVMKEWGLDYTTLLQHNPRLIYVAVTGYGQNSHKAADAGHDLNYIATAGALSITYDDGGQPVIPGFQLADVGGGSYMAMNAVLAALYQRERTGKGDFVDVSMTDGVMPFNVLQYARYQAEKGVVKEEKFELSGGLANYNVYKCSDGKFIALGSLEPKFWQQFCAKAGKPEWANAFLYKGEKLKQLKQEVKTFFLAKTAAEWASEFKNEDICLTVVNGLGDLGNDVYLKERKMLVDNAHPLAGNYKTINQPLKFMQNEFANNWCAPQLGEDTANILKELGYADERITELRKNNIVKI